MSGHIVVVGSLNMDLVVRVPRHPKLGETLLGGSFGTFPGGKGANQAVAAARLGGAVRMVGRVGVDAFGDTLIQALVQDGVGTTNIVGGHEAPTGVALITVDAAGQNTIVVAAGANAQLSPEDVDTASAVFVGAAIVLLQLEIPLLSVARAVELAQRSGAQIVLNPAPAQPLDPALLAHVDYLIPNETELAVLAGIDGPDALCQSVSRLQAAGARRVVVTLGADGALVVDHKRSERLPAHHVTVVDTTAAGDAFVGAFAVALAEGRSIYEAARWGNAAGALAVTRVVHNPRCPTVLSSKHSWPGQYVDASGQGCRLALGGVELNNGIHR